MTEADDDPALSGDDVDGFVTPEFTAAIDWFTKPDAELQDLIGVANIGFGLGVTLYLPWGIASGHIAPNHAFFRSIADKLREEASASDNEDVRVVTEAVARRSFDRWADPMPEPDRLKQTIRNGWDLTSYIHLSNAQAWFPGWSQPQQHDQLRIRLSSITAWAYGLTRG
ncbi:hypothetical protein [Mycolicibacterium baixiangningiae]|uniref:hypothetical protein n=1 Tax=Mycolicibacterium baixiangningiae TaxID=2761578 RepID=UPI0018685037|nr:hypothetical protein [Mycolicibacterium baixiangningiae]